MDRRTVVGTVLGVLGFILLAAEAPFVLSSGLIMPLWAVGLLVVIWAGAVVLGITWWRRRRWAIVLLPSAVALIWLIMAALGEHFLGWTA